VSRECYGLPEIAAALGNAAGRDIKYQRLDTEEFRAVLERAAPAVTMSVALGEAVRAGEFDPSHPALQTLLGAPTHQPAGFPGQELEDLRRSKSISF
jgi:hypothetical protein